MPKLGSFGTGSTKSLGFQGFRPPSPSGQATAVYPATIASNSTGLTNTNTGTFTWTAPAYVTKVNIVMVGGGGGGGGLGKNSGGGGGGSLTYANNIPVNAGVTYNITVGGGGTVNIDGEKTWFNNSTYLFANGGSKGARNDSDATGQDTYTPSTAGNINNSISINAGSSITSGTLGSSYRYAWTCPTGVFYIQVVCVGGGGGGGAYGSSGGAGGQGGTLSYKNSIPVIPGRVYNLEAGLRGSNAGGTIGGDSCFYDLTNLTVTNVANGTGYITITGSDVSKLLVNAFIVFAGTLGGIVSGQKYIIVSVSSNIITVKDRWGGVTITSWTTASGTMAAQSTTIMASGGAPGIGSSSNITHGGTGVVSGIKLGDGGGWGGLGGTASNTIGAGGGGAGGYAGNGGNGGSVSGTIVPLAVISGAGQAGSGGGSGGGSAGSFHSATTTPTATSATRVGAGAGGGTGILGQGGSGGGTAAPDASTTATGPTTYGGKPGSYVASTAGGSQATVNTTYPTLAGPQPSNPALAYGAAGGGGSADQAANGGTGGDGAVRIIYGPNRSFPATNTAFTTATTYASYALQGGGGGGAAGYSSSGGIGGTYVLGTTAGGAGGVAFSGTIAGATIVSNAGGAGGNANPLSGILYDAATNPGGGAAAGGSGGNGPFGGGGVSYLGLQALNQDSANNTTTPGAATNNGSSALVSTNGGSKGGSGTGGITGTGTGGTGGGGGPGGGWGGSGGPGFLRITWGEGRSYPDILTMDLFQAGNFTSGLSYTIARLGSTSQGQWNTLAGTSGLLYSVGSIFTPTSTISGSYGTGTAYRS